MNELDVRETSDVTTSVLTTTERQIRGGFVDANYQDSDSGWVSNRDASLWHVAEVLLRKAMEPDMQESEDCMPWSASEHTDYEHGMFTLYVERESEDSDVWQWQPDMASEMVARVRSLTDELLSEVIPFKRQWRCRVSACIRIIMLSPTQSKVIVSVQ